MQVCYNIYLTASTRVNQATARATLTQMINEIFMRLARQNEKSRGMSSSSADRNLSSVDREESSISGDETQSSEKGGGKEVPLQDTAPSKAAADDLTVSEESSFGNQGG